MISLHEQCVGNLKLYEEVYESMLLDYGRLLGTEPIINEMQYEIRDFESEIELLKRLMQCNKGNIKVREEDKFINNK